MVASSLVTVGYSFLTTGPNFRLSVPSDFHSLPKLGSPITIRNGTAPRTLDFLPTWADGGVVGYSKIRELRDRDGRTVELYERQGTPPLWYLRWILSNGFVYTYLDESDGPDYAEVDVREVSIIERADSSPFVVLDSPLAAAVSAFPGYAETAGFSSVTSPDWGVELIRPTSLKPGQVMVLPYPDRVMLRAGAQYGCEVTIIAGSDRSGGELLLDEVLNSLAEG